MIDTVAFFRWGRRVREDLMCKPIKTRSYELCASIEQCDVPRESIDGLMRLGGLSIVSSLECLVVGQLPSQNKSGSAEVLRSVASASVFGFGNAIFSLLEVLREFQLAAGTNDDRHMSFRH